MTLGFCPKCGAARTGERFCGKCGTDFEPQPTTAPAEPSMTRQVIRSQAQNVLPRIGAFIAFWVVGIVVLSLTSEVLGPSNLLIWLLVSLGAAIVAAWAVGTWILVRLA